MFLVYVLDKAGSLTVIFSVQIIYRIISYRIVSYRIVSISDMLSFRCVWPNDLETPYTPLASVSLPLFHGPNRTGYLLV